MNPATFLRVLGPEPWKVCYAEPSVRPDDSRYGDNPNRVQRHTQFQVILKPEPGNPQELYLASLEALGIDTRKHDVRFVEDNWKSPVLGAWGLGWEVWLDGMEVTQFTYFQQAGSLQVDPVATEITYGLERILMALQGVDHFKDIRYNDHLTYGDMFLQNEYEMSCYNMDLASVEDQRQRFELFDAEAQKMVEARLPIPAYDNVLKSSHAFNILDARGAVGLAERATFFGKMRRLARECANLWLERREELGYPMGLAEEAVEPPPVRLGTAPSSAAPFVIELGTEELPPQDVTSGLEQLHAGVTGILERAGLSHGEVRTGATPRRLSIVVEDLAHRTEDKEERKRGPPTKACYDAEGNPTKALEGFCRKNGIGVEDVVKEMDGKTEYVFATVTAAGSSAVDLLAAELPAVIKGISFPGTMRWRAPAGVSFSRPVRWILSLHGECVVPFAALGLCSGNTTCVLRNSDEPIRTVKEAAAYASLLDDAGITLDVAARQAAIWSAAQALAGEAGGVVPDSAREGLLQEVANLVEAPTPLCGAFDEAFLDLPKEVLVITMRKHQRYFPVEHPETGELLPAFIAVANGPIDLDTVRGGNEAVLRARYEDARFFYEQDLKKSLEEFRPALEGVMFETALGNQLQKSERAEALIPVLATMTGVEGSPAADAAAAAARLYRADLTTSVVMEMTSLAGVMGKHYALKDGLDEAVAEAVYEAVLPRQSGDSLPQTDAGALVALADRLDSLVGLFAAGGAPTATKDVFGLRRVAYGLVQTLVARGYPFDLVKAVAASAALQPIDVPAEVQEEVVVFVTRRLEQLFVDDGIAVEYVRAVLPERGTDPGLAEATLRELAAVGEGEAFQATLEAFGRPTRLVRGKETGDAASVDPALFEHDEERALWGAYEQASATIDARMSLPDFLVAIKPVEEAVGPYFDKVFVMAEDEAIRANRLAALAAVARLPNGVLSFEELPGF